jgi:hypothetical protein
MEVSRIFDIYKNDAQQSGGHYKTMLDWSERGMHIAGQIGAMLLSKMLEKNWFRRVQFSRELIVHVEKGKRNGWFIEY